MTEKAIEVSYPFRKEKCRIDLSKTVYYSIYYEPGFREKSILISNQPFEADINKAIDYSTQALIRYSKRIERECPLEGWKEIKPHNPGVW